MASNAAAVARCAPLANATRNSGPESATGGATADRAQVGNSPMTGRELRAQLKAQQARNPAATLAAQAMVESCAPRDALEHEAPMPDPDMERRRGKGFALLAEDASWRRVVIAEAGEPVIIGVAIRDLGYGELEIPAAHYDARALLEILDRYGGEAPTLH